MPTTTLQGKTLSTVELNWKEVFYTNCGMVSASNVDQELTWCRTDFAAIGVDYAHLLSRRENDWYPHYIHNLDNLLRFGGLYPPLHVEADIHFPTRPSSRRRREGWNDGSGTDAERGTDRKSVGLPWGRNLNPDLLWESAKQER